MNNFEDFFLKSEYEKLKAKDKLFEFNQIIDWESLRPIVSDLYHNDTEKGGRPNIDEIVMVKVLFLQAVYDNPSDEKLEKELIDRLTFRNFLNYPDQLPDAKTIWHFRELLTKTGTDKTLWKAIWKQFNNKGIKVKNGTIQDATFIRQIQGTVTTKRTKEIQ
ncbi:MAG: transposase [Thermoplasmata archaeon]